LLKLHRSPKARLSRAAAKQQSRDRLIAATLASIAKRGISETTLARVARGAGLSRGIVNFHFETKEALFVEALRYMGHEYRTHWKRAFDKAGPSVAQKLKAVLEVDFEPPIATKDRLAVWFAFYGEAQSRPIYVDLCRSPDDAFFDEIGDLCGRLIEEGGYQNLDPELIVQSLSAMAEGMWLDLLVAPHSINRNKAKRALLAYVSAVFPKHFSVTTEDGFA
jgi:TetR/AcrR family transcriptional repressor of bet genes